jgi:hypothetical protein
MGSGVPAEGRKFILSGRPAGQPKGGNDEQFMCFVNFATTPVPGSIFGDRPPIAISAG